MSGHITTRLFDVVHDICLVHHVPLTERYELFKLIREQFTTDVYSGRIQISQFHSFEGQIMPPPFHSLPDNGTVDDWDDMREAESGVDNEYTFRVWLSSLLVEFSIGYERCRCKRVLTSPS